MMKIIEGGNIINAAYKYLNDIGYYVQPTAMCGYIDNWAAWRRGKVGAFHNYNWYNGEKNIACERRSLQLAKVVSETWANMLFNERCLITIDGEDITMDGGIKSKTAQYVKSIFDDNNLWVRLNEAQELKCAYGTVAYIPRARNLSVSVDDRILGGGSIITDIVTADRLIPISWENGIITELAVVSDKFVKSEKYNYIQLFVFENGFYVIENRLIKLSESGSYQVVPTITQIPGFEQVTPKVITNSAEKPFIIDKPNIANNIDDKSALGISVYANAIDAIKTCDLIFDSISIEFSLGRTRLFAAPQLMMNKDGKPIFDPKDVMFQFMRLGNETADSIQKLIDVIQPLLRIDEHEKGMQLALNIFSSLCGLGENYYRLNGSSIATATQVISEQSVAYKTREKHGKVLESALHDFIRLIISIGINILKIQGLNPGADIKIKFDDGIIEDKQSLKKQDLTEVAQGIMTVEEYRMKWYGETLEQAENTLGGRYDTATNPYESTSSDGSN